nr:hypothetical protein [Gammaproteobacteria bacterium]
MTPSFTVQTTPRFDREARSLRKRQPDFTKQLAVAIDPLRHDPYNRSRTHTIKKLEAVPPGEGQYRLRLRRFRFRYDIEENTVTLRYCGLRREDTYR